MHPPFHTRLVIMTPLFQASKFLLEIPVDISATKRWGGKRMNSWKEPHLIFLLIHFFFFAFGKEMSEQIVPLHFDCIHISALDEMGFDFCIRKRRMQRRSAAIFPVTHRHQWKNQNDFHTFSLSSHTLCVTRFCILTPRELPLFQQRNNPGNKVTFSHWVMNNNSDLWVREAYTHSQASIQFIQVIEVAWCCLQTSLCFFVPSILIILIIISGRHRCLSLMRDALSDLLKVAHTSNWREGESEEQKRVRERESWVTRRCSWWGNGCHWYWWCSHAFTGFWREDGVRSYTFSQERE